MSAEHLAETLGAATERRRVLKRAGAAAMAGALYLMGRPPVAEAAFQHGCGLCDPAPRDAPCSNLACSWCWWGTCHTNPGGSSRHQTHCCEGYRAGSSCGGGCGDHWQCSFFGTNRPC